MRPTLGSNPSKRAKRSHARNGRCAASLAQARKCTTLLSAEGDALWAAARRRTDPGDGGEEHLRLWATPPDGEGVPRLARPAWLRLAHRLAQPPRPGPPAPPRRSKPALGSHAHAHTASMPPRRAAVATHPATRGCCRGGHSAYLETLREAAAAEGVEFYYYKGTSPLQRADKALFDLARASTPSTASGPCSSGISPSSPTTHT